MNNTIHRVGLLGARGHVGAELIRLIDRHPLLELGFVSSREWEGQPLSAQFPGYARHHRFVAYSPQQAAQAEVDVLILAMPNGAAAPYVGAVEAGQNRPLLLDLSADYRFDASWCYGLPELGRTALAGARRIANPGCYATAMQLLIAPMRDCLAGPVQCFGVSGYSGAGTTPSDKNNPDKLRDNLMPYALTGHVHEREVSHRLDHPVQFMPHVAAYFRGLTITASMPLARTIDLAEVEQRYRQRYAGEALIEISAQPPWVSRIAGQHGVQIGGFSLDASGQRLVAVSVLDNLLKGAATQALQNINLALGLAERLGISHD